MDLARLGKSLGFGAALLGVTAMAGADTKEVLINFDGVGNDAQKVTALDWNVGNTLGLGGQSALNHGVGSKFTVLYQAALSVFNTTGDSVKPVGFEWTVVASIPVVVTGTGLNPSYVFDPTGTDNLIRIFFDNNLATKANDLAGTGFADGHLIFEATVSDYSATLLRTRGTANTNLDQFAGPSSPPINNYPGVHTITGVGGSGITADVTFVDPAFFVDTPIGATTLFAANDGVPFLQADPSRLFTDGVLTVTPNTGALNGVTGVDFRRQSDSSQSFTAGPPHDNFIPEPASLAVMGLAGLGLVRRRRGA